MKIQKFKLANQKNKALANLTHLEQLNEHPGWANVKIGVNSNNLRVLMPFYITTFYVNLNAPKAASLMKKVTSIGSGSGKMGSNYLSRILSYHGSPALIEEEKKALGHSNLSMFRMHLQNLGAADEDILVNNQKALMRGLWDIAENLTRNEGIFSHELSTDQHQILADVVMYIAVGPKAHMKYHSKVATFLQPHVTKHVELEVPDDDYTPKSKTRSVSEIEIEKFRDGSMDPQEGEQQLLAAWRSWQEWIVTHKTLKDKDFSNNNDYSFGTSPIDRYPFLNFQEFCTQIGSHDIALLILLSSGAAATYFKDLYAATRKSLKPPTDRYARTRRARMKMYNKKDAYERDKAAKADIQSIDWTQFKPQSWMLKYVATECLPVLEKLFKLVSKPQAAGFTQGLTKDPDKIRDYIKTFTGKALRSQLTGLQIKISDYEYLTDEQIQKVIRVLDDAEALKFFEKCLDLRHFKQIFLSFKLQEAYKTKSPFGKLNAEDAARALVQGEDEDAPSLSLSRSVSEAWDPRNYTWEHFLANYLPKKDAIGSNDKGTIVVADKRDDYTPVEEALRAFMSYGHGVDFKIKKVWNLHLCDAAKTFLKNNMNNPNLKIIKNGFHGTATSAAGAIMLSGFKLKGTLKTARSMGDVLYIAPNFDKSLQYITAGGHGRDTGTGIIFHGDLAVLGTPVNDAAAIQDTTQCNWTLTTQRFATQEIGLVDANVQFILRHAYLVTRTRSSYYGGNGGISDADKTERTKFKQSIPIQEYLEGTDILARKAPLNIMTKKLMRERNAERKARQKRITPIDNGVPAMPITKVSDSLKGISICWLRGQLQEDIKTLLLSNGGTWDETLKKSTTYLVLKNPHVSNRPRAIKARQHGIPEVGTKEIRAILVNLGAR
jgi:hypothetical protein